MSSESVGTFLSQDSVSEYSEYCEYCEYCVIFAGIQQNQEEGTREA